MLALASHEPPCNTIAVQKQTSLFQTVCPKKTLAGGENGISENRSATYCLVREYRKRKKCHLQPAQEIFEQTVRLL